VSVAFTKEDSAETASETLLPDRPISPHPNLVTEAGLKALQSQLDQAREACEAAMTLPSAPIKDTSYTRVDRETRTP